MQCKRPSPGLVLSVGAIVLALGGTGYAATKIGTGQIKDSAVTSLKIKDGQVKDKDLGGGAVTGRAIATGAVMGDKIAAGAVDGSKLAAGAVGNSKLATAAVDSGKIAAGAVDNSKLATAAVDGSKIAAGAVDSSKLAAGSVDDSKVAPGSLTGGSIKAASIPAGDIAAGSFINGPGTSSSNAGVLTSGTTDFRMLSLGGVDILADCTAQVLRTKIEPFATNLWVQDEVISNAALPAMGAGELQLGDPAAVQAANVNIAMVRWMASWTDTAGAHVRTANISYQPTVGGCQFTASALAQN